MSSVIAAERQPATNCACSEQTRTSCSAMFARAFRRNRCTCQGRTSWTGSWHRPTARARYCAACSRCSGMGAWPEPAICRSCRWTRASSTPPVHRSPRTPRISIRRTSSSSPSKAAATPWPLPWVCLGQFQEVRAQIPSCSSSITTNPHLSEQYDQITLPASSRRATWERSRSERRSILGSAESARQIGEVSKAFEIAHEMEWPRCCGDTCAIRRSNPTRTTTCPPT